MHFPIALFLTCTTWVTAGGWASPSLSCPAAYLWSHLVLFVSLWAAEDGGGFLGGFEAGVKPTTDNLSFSAMHRSSSIILSRRSSSLPQSTRLYYWYCPPQGDTHFPELPAGCSTEGGGQDDDHDGRLLWMANHWYSLIIDVFIRQMQFSLIDKRRSRRIGTEQYDRTDR